MIDVTTIQNTSLYDIHILDPHDQLITIVHAGRLVKPAVPVQVGGEGLPYIQIQYQDRSFPDWYIRVQEPDSVHIRQLSGDSDITCQQTGSVQLRISYSEITLCGLNV